MANERVTETIVRNFYLKEQRADKDIIIDEQVPLPGASKNGTGNTGYPEFIIKHKKYPDICIVVECKADIVNQVKAIEEVKHYRDSLIDTYKHVAILAVSGNLGYSKTYMAYDKQDQIVELNKMISMQEVIDEVTKDVEAEEKTIDEIMKYAKYYIIIYEII